MKKIGLVLIGLMFIFSFAYADKVITITLTDEEYKALSVLTSSPEEWVTNAAKNKAGKMVNELADKYSSIKVEKMTEVEKRAIINSIDLTKEKESRTGKIK